LTDKMGINVFDTNLDQFHDSAADHNIRGYLSNGEVHYLWYFMQGSIMDPDVRRQLRNSWGFCQRHMAGWLIIESAFHNNYLHGPSILLDDLIGRAQKHLYRYQVPMVAAVRLRNKKPCLMCSLGYNKKSTGYANANIMRRGLDMSYLRQYAHETGIYWRKFVCPQCVGDPENEGILCRTHLIHELSQNKNSSINSQSASIDYLHEQLTFFSRSFRWEYRGTETSECKASLISVAGWLSGWTEFINLIDKWR
jgi:hypothetical protein